MSRSHGTSRTADAYVVRVYAGPPFMRQRTGRRGPTWLVASVTRCGHVRGGVRRLIECPCVPRTRKHVDSLAICGKRPDAFIFQTAARYRGAALGHRCGMIAPSSHPYNRDFLMIRFLTPLAAVAMLVLASCGPNAEHRSADSTALAASVQRAQLVTLLAAQKDSLTRVVLQADDFIMHIDSSVSSMKSLPKGKRVNGQLDPLARQIENRKVVMARVDALVARARATAALLSKANSNGVALRAQLASDSAMISDLNATIKRQTATIAALSLRVDSLHGAAEVLAATLTSVNASLTTVKASLTSAESAHNKAYYVIGREDELVKQGVIVREGGSNLLFAHPGRTLQVARTLDPELFTVVDQRDTQLIPVPDTTRRYRVVSRQSLDDAVVSEREQNSFKGNLRIAGAEKFWAPSRYLVLLQQ